MALKERSTKEWIITKADFIAEIERIKGQSMPAGYTAQIVGPNSVYGPGHVGLLIERAVARTGFIDKDRRLFFIELSDVTNYLTNRGESVPGGAMVDLTKISDGANGFETAIRVSEAFPL